VLRMTFEWADDVCGEADSVCRTRDVCRETARHTQNKACIADGGTRKTRSGPRAAASSPTCPIGILRRYAPQVCDNIILRRLVRHRSFVLKGSLLPFLAAYHAEH
jgi:hypothetical protein